MTGPGQLATAVREALRAAGLPDAEPTFERPRQREHGDWSTNVALVLARRAGVPPREVAQRLVSKLPDLAGVVAVEVAGPGFVNFRLSHEVLEQVIREAVNQGHHWGWTDEERKGRVNVEFVSANPTGPLHVGHGRQAVIGDALASLLVATGWDVTREYYFNDAGNQMRLFGESVAAVGRGDEPPENGYRGSYVRELADELRASGELDGDVVEAAYARMLARIKRTLSRLGVTFDVYFGERTLHAEGTVDAVIAGLRGRGQVYDADGAVWLRTVAFGDDKDRVLIKADGTPTYFAADCAYLHDKINRGFDLVLYVLGADHHGYVGRLRAIAAAEGLPAGRLEVVLHQFVNLLRAGEVVRMSKRTGELITLDELIDEVGPDAARYTFLRYSNEVTIDFDLAEVVKAERENPVYYVQYSSARIAGIIRKATERGVDPGSVDDARLALLTHETEAELIRRIAAYPETVHYAAVERAPHKVARYAEDLAEAFHKFYTECQVVSDDVKLTVARYWLCIATRQTLGNALGILGVSAPDRM